jgi:hypothetical protein
LSKITGKTAPRENGESSSAIALTDETAASRNVFSLGSPACSRTRGKRAIMYGSNCEPKPSKTAGRTLTADSLKAAFFLSSSAFLRLSTTSFALEAV